LQVQVLPGVLEEASSGGARPEGIATPESSLQVRVLPGVFETAFFSTF
jgi:hypothetical protein